jgi:L-asparagine transporter-like permease
MSKYYKFFEYAYLVISVFFLVETFLTWKTDPQKAYIFLAFSILAIFMYFFRKKYRKRLEDNEK